MIAIVCHDAGGAELISSYVKKNKRNYIFVLKGPAIKIFKNKLGKKIKLTNLKNAVKKADKLLCGSSVASKFELKAIIEFKKKKKCTIVFLDHWINYKKRFKYNDTIALPNSIWVADKFALNLCKLKFPKVNLTLKKNEYLIDLKEKIRKIKKYSIKNNNNTILYLSEPITEFSSRKKIFNNYKGTQEFKTFKYFIDNINVFKIKKYQIIFRTHPSEKIEKYYWIMNLGLKIKFSKNTNLLSDIIKSKIIVGRQTMAMIVGLLANKKVISCIPPNEKRCCLPYKKIKELRDII